MCSAKSARFRVAQELRGATALTWAQVFRLAVGELIDGMDASDWLRDSQHEPRLTARETRNERYDRDN